MKVIQIKKVKNLYEVIFDNEVIKYHEEVIIKYNLLRSNIEITEEQYIISLLDNRFYLARDRAINYLKSLKFKSQIKEYLMKYEEEFIAKRVIENLVEMKLINEYATTTSYALSKYNSGYGSIELIRRLNDFRVNPEIINQVILEQREEEINGINKYIKKILKTTKAINNKDLKNKIENKLNMHGYLFSDINDVLNEVKEYIYQEEFDQEIFKKYLSKAINKYDDVTDKFIQERKIRDYLINKGFAVNLVKEEVNNWKNTKGD